jgi:hypothetical protein
VHHRIFATPYPLFLQVKNEDVTLAKKKCRKAEEWLKKRLIVQENTAFSEVREQQAVVLHNSDTLRVLIDRR